MAYDLRDSIFLTAAWTAFSFFNCLLDGFLAVFTFSSETSFEDNTDFEVSISVVASLLKKIV